MISFVVIGRNEGWRLKLCLDSLQRVVKDDGILDYEIIYVDSKSADDSIALAKSYPKTRVFLITGECNAGIGRNIGANEAKGDVLMFVDGDMEVQPGFLSQVLIDDKKLTYPFISGLHLDYVYDDDWNLKYTELQEHPQGVDGFYRLATGGLMIVERTYWDKLGGIDSRLKANEDYDFGLRMTEMGIRPYRKCQLLVKHHTLSHYSSNRYITWVKYTAVVWRKHWKNLPYFKHFILHTQYTAFLFLFCLIFSLVTMILLPSSWWLLIWLSYVLLVMYKAKKQGEISILKMSYRIFMRDIVFLWATLFFYPKPIKLQYKEM